MAITFDVPFAGAQGTTATSTGNATPNSVGGGVGLIIAAIVLNGNTGNAAPTVTDSYSNAYTVLSLGNVTGSIDFLYLAYAQNAANTSGHVTTTSLAGTSAIAAGHWKGLATTGPLDQTSFAASGSTGTALDPGNMIATQFNNELIIGAGTQATATNMTYTAGSGFTIASSVLLASTGRNIYLQYKIVAATGVYDAPASSSVTANWAAFAAAFADTTVVQPSLSVATGSYTENGQAATLASSGAGPVYFTGSGISDAQPIVLNGRRYVTRRQRMQRREDLDNWAQGKK